jgi:hypothetical protein
MWGRHLVLDCSAGYRKAVRDGGMIRGFCEDLVSSIGMVAYWEPVLEHFATHPPRWRRARSVSRW